MNHWKRTFSTIWIGQAFSILSSAILQMALIWHLSATTQSATILSVASLAGFLPTALLGTFAGAWVDRLHRKRVLIAADLFIAAVSMIAALGIMGTALLVSGLLPGNEFPVFAALCVMMGLSSPLYTVPQTALMQERIPPKYLGRAFGIYGGLMSLAMPIGLVLSGTFADQVGVPLWFTLTGGGVLGLMILSFLTPSIRRIDRKE